MSKPKTQTIVITGLSIAFSITIFGLSKIYIVNSEFISSVASAATIYALIFAGYQIHQNLEIKRKEKSIELAKEFAEMVNDLGFIDHVLSKIPGYADLINKHDPLKFQTFRMEELNRLYPNEDHQKILLEPEKKFKDIFLDIVDGYTSTRSISDEERDTILRYGNIGWDNVTLLRKVIDEEVSNSGLEEISGLRDKLSRIDIEALLQSGVFDAPGLNLNESEILRRVISSYARNSNSMLRFRLKIMACVTDTIGSTMNHCEYFAMAFNTNLADDKVVYQSLHQVYLRVIMLLYPFICRYNKNSIADHYYVNVIQLYSRWSNMYKKQCDKVKKQSDNAILRSSRL